MTVTYKQAESYVCPSEIDTTSSKDGIFMRRNIKQVETEDGVKYTYQEAFLNVNEYASYSKDLLVNQFNGEDNTAEYEVYKQKLDTGVIYKNGKYYKPKWIDLYSGIIDSFAAKIMLYEKAGGDVSQIVALTTAVYDVTGKEENAEIMSVIEVINLWLYLYSVKEQYYAEYKASLE